MTDTIVSTQSETVEVSPTVEVRRRVPVSAALGLAGSGVAIAYLVRATSTGSVLDWALCAVMAVVGGVQLLALLDARSPLLVADDLGLRVRRGRTWHGLPWSDVERVEHLAPRGPLRDGRLDVFGADGTEWSVRLGLATRVIGGGDDLATTLLERSDFTADVVEIEIVAPEGHHDDSPDVSDEAFEAVPFEAVPVEAVPVGGLVEGPAEADVEPESEPKHPAFASPTPSPLRALLKAARSEIRRDPKDPPTVGATALHLDEVDAEHALPESGELRRDSDGLEDTAYWAGGLATDDPSEPGDVTVVIDDLAAVPVADPVVGPELAAARARLALSVDQLAERTRIRPHVIEAIEVDDFAPCGGDFYARGHLRTLARVLGVDAAPLLTSYDERYADAPVDPRRVFEAELATGFNGSIRGSRGGPNWSVLVAAVMAVVLVWSIAQLLDRPAPADDALRLNGSSGPRNPGAVNAGPKVSFVLTAVGGGATIVVRDGGGNVAYDGSIAFMQSVELDVVPPVRVQSSDGSLTVKMDGEDQGAIGVTGQEAQDTYVVRD